MRSGRRIERAGRCRLDRRWFGTAVAAAFCLTACAASPPFDDSARAGVSDWRPSEALEYPEAYGQRVIWGGQIVAVVNHASETELQILSYPLDRRYRPLAERPPGVRFVALYDGFLDPALFAAGRFVSTTGHIGGEQVIRVGNERHVAPLLTIEGIDLWEDSQGSRGPGRVSISVGVGIRF